MLLSQSHKRKAVRGAPVDVESDPDKATRGELL
jgi:hypothetical protein